MGKDVEINSGVSTKVLGRLDAYKGEVHLDPKTPYPLVKSLEGETVVVMSQAEYRNMQQENQDLRATAEIHEAELKVLRKRLHEREPYQEGKDPTYHNDVPVKEEEDIFAGAWAV